MFHIYTNLLFTEFECLCLGNWSDAENASVKILSRIPLSPKINPFISSMDIKTLDDGQQLNDNIINTCIDLIEKESSKIHDLYCRTYLLTKVFCLNEDTTGTLTSFQLLFGWFNLGSLEWSHHDQLPTQLQNLQNIKRIFLPLLYQRHYILYLVNLENQEITVYDSLFGSLHHLDEIEKFVQFWMNQKGIPLISFQKLVARCPRQTDENSCGVHFIINLVTLSQENESQDEVNIKIWRKKIKQWILNGSIGNIILFILSLCL